MSAKIACSAVFITGREVEDALTNSAPRFWGSFRRERITKVEVDRANRAVHLTLDGSLRRSARLFGDQGCVILPRGRDSVAFTPVPVRTSLGPAASAPWRMGDRLPDTPLPAGLDRARLEAGLDLAFRAPEALSLAMVVVHRGRIVAERYAPGIGQDTQLESWSMGKSITAAMVGLLVRQGKLRLDDPAPVAEWQTPGDPRARITIRDLMQMSSGLRFSDATDPPETWGQAHPDHLYVYSGAIDVFGFSIGKQPEFPPQTVGRYRNVDPLVLGAIVKRTVSAAGDEYLSWPQRALFDRIGIRRQVLEPDPYGNFLLTGYDYGTARNWARLGLLYLQDGVWQGERLLPEGWTRFVSTPAPAWSTPVYGGLFRLNGDGEWSLPRDAYFMSGGGVSKTIVVPSHDLVIVRMGHLQGTRKHEADLNLALAEILAAIPRRGD